MTGPIEVSIRVDGRDGQPAGSLYRWLTLDPQVRRESTVSMTPAPPGAGGMGGALELINVVLSNSVAVGGLIVAVVSWRKSRPRPPETRIEIDGDSFVIENASPETVALIVRALTERPVEPGEGAGDGAL